jgi:hypothetical protein
MILFNHEKSIENMLSEGIQTVYLNTPSIYPLIFIGF